MSKSAAYIMKHACGRRFLDVGPTITALIQELTGGQFVQANTFLLAGIKGGGGLPDPSSAS